MKQIYEYINNKHKESIVEYLTTDINNLADSFDEDDRFWIEAVTDLTIKSFNYDKSLHISDDGENWIDCEEYTLAPGDILYLYIDDDKCMFEGEFNIGGNLLGLFTKDAKLDRSIFRRGTNGAFRLTFNNSDVIDASELTLPNLTDTYRVFMDMFEGCKKLKHINKYLFRNFNPKHNRECCLDMFNGCESLLNTPELPTDLSEGCYKFMFEGCESLTQAPDLPAMTLAEDCYVGMFKDCKSLTQAPSLPATKLFESCYSSMFSGCEKLTQAPVLPATKLFESCYSSMFSGCTSLTQAPVLPAMTLAKNCYKYMFMECTSLTQAPDLPAMTLAESCYMFMFLKCPSLAQAPILPATQLASHCYEGIFSDDPLIKYIETHADPKYGADWKSYGFMWILNGSKTGTIKKHHDLILPSGGKGTPARWKVIDL